jgi:steroid 5-alpha reductase family enzyme
MDVLAVLVAGPGGVLPIAALAVGVLMLVVWAVSIGIRDVSIVDVAWGPAFVAVALAAALGGGGEAARRWLVFGLTAVWGLRLGLHLLARKLAEPGEDPRYGRLRARHPRRSAWWKLGAAVFIPQTVLVLVVSLPIQVAAGRSSSLSLWILPGLALFVVGVVFEAVGDEQLRRFKADARHAGLIMDRGLWRYTRHPNYFGDACVWWGLWLVALQAGGTWWTAVGPATMTLLLVRVSGKELLERGISLRRPGYADYVRRTSGFVPLPPRGKRR